MNQPAVFLDKDGTLIEDVPYNVNPDLIRLTSGAAEALPVLHGAGYRLIVISNQSGVARGYFPESALRAVETRLCDLLGQLGVPLAGFYYCPHHPNGSIPAYTVACACRKPAPGLLQRAAAELNLDLARSWFVGDILDDMEAGRRAGCRTIMLANGNETEWQLSAQRLPHFVVTHFGQIARVVIGVGRQQIQVGNFTPSSIGGV